MAGDPDEQPLLGGGQQTAVFTSVLRHWEVSLVLQCAESAAIGSRLEPDYHQVRAGDRPHPDSRRAASARRCSSATSRSASACRPSSATCWPASSSGRTRPGFVADAHVAEQLAEIGVILLMFGVGLQFHLEELLAVRRIAIPGAIAQSGDRDRARRGRRACLRLDVAGVDRVRPDALGRQHRRAGPRAVRRRQLHTPAGHIAVGWLVVEDVLTVVVLVLLPTLKSAASRLAALATSIGAHAAEGRPASSPSPRSSAAA